MYDLFNFASELATHRFAKRQSQEAMQAWIGATLTREYDLEGTVQSFPDYADYFLNPAPGSDPAPGNNPSNPVTIEA